MDVGDLIPIFGIVLVMIPVAGLTLRLMVGPFLERLIEALNKIGALSSGQAQSAEIEKVHARLDDLTRLVEQVRDAGAFDRALQSGDPPRETEVER